MFIVLSNDIEYYTKWKVCIIWGKGYIYNLAECYIGLRDFGLVLLSVATNHLL